MNVSEVVNSLNGKCALCHVESCHILRKNVVLHQHSHKVTTGEEFHDQVQIEGILERVEKLHNPW